MDNVKIGKIVNTHGIKGELKVAFTDSSFFEKGLEIQINVGKDFLSETISTCRLHKNHMLIVLDGYSNINDVLKYKNCDIYINRKDGDVFLSDYVGYDVFNNDVLIGKVAEIYNNNAHDILVLDNGSMIPFVDQFVVDIDDTNKCFHVLLIEGLLDDN